jgi:hypothetical protein
MPFHRRCLNASDGKTRFTQTGRRYDLYFHFTNAGDRSCREHGNALAQVPSSPLLSFRLRENGSEMGGRESGGGGELGLEGGAGVGHGGQLLPQAPRQLPLLDQRREENRNRLAFPLCDVTQANSALGFADQIFQTVVNRMQRPIGIEPMPIKIDPENMLIENSKPTIPEMCPK